MCVCVYIFKNHFSDCRKCRQEYIIPYNGIENNLYLLKSVSFNISHRYISTGYINISKKHKPRAWKYKG